MERIDDLIGMHQEITRREEPIIISKLRMINDLYPECADSVDAMLFDEIINTFADIVQKQKDIIEDLRMEIECTSAGNARPRGFSHNYIGNPVQHGGELENDEQVRDAFAHYLSYETDKPLSSYTINDYCSRIRNLWKSFYTAHQNGELPDELYVSERASAESPLLHAFGHVEELNCYATMMSAASDEKKNWANIGAALNKFAKFVCDWKTM